MHLSSMNLDDALDALTAPVEAGQPNSQHRVNALLTGVLESSGKAEKALSQPLR